MPDFFKNMNLARAIIVATLPLAILLTVTWRGMSANVAEMGDDIDIRVPKLVSEIQQLAIDHSRLSKELNSEGIRGQDNPETYIRKVATSNKVEIGDVRINNNKRTPMTGVVDHIYTIRPSDGERAFSRVKISNFLYKLEEDSSRIKVTDVSIDIAERRVKNHVVPRDEWTFTAQVTSRQAE